MRVEVGRGRGGIPDSTYLVGRSGAVVSVLGHKLRLDESVEGIGGGNWWRELVEVREVKSPSKTSTRRTIPGGVEIGGVSGRL